MYLVFLGAPGAGKGTQAVAVSRQLGLAHLASGDLFRQAQARGDELGRQVKSYVEKGLLVPDEITIKMIQERLESFGPEQSCILDGFPRTLEQARALDKMLSQRQKAIDRAVTIDVSPDELITRLTGRLTCRQCQAPYHKVNSPPKVAGRCDRCGGELYERADDAPATVKKRIEVYLEQTAPLTDYYRKAGKLLSVDGTQAIDKVTLDIVAALTSPARPTRDERKGR